MFLLGFCSLIQILILPGTIALYKLNLKILDKALLVIPSSLLINFILVFYLVKLKIYENNYLLIIFLLELLLLIILLNKKILILFNKLNINILTQNFVKIDFNLKLIDLTFIFFLLTYSFISFKYIGTTFVAGDVLNSWNNWALIWSNNGFPSKSEIGHYGQLWPAIISINYVFIKSEIQVFATFIPLVFPILTIIMIYRIGFFLEDRIDELKLSSIIFSFIYINIAGSINLFTGLTDPIIVFYFVLSIYLLSINYTQAIQSFTRNCLFIVIISAAVSIKQAGIPVLVLYISYYFFFISKKDKLYHIFIYLLLILLILYPYFDLNISNNIGNSNLITNLHLTEKNLLDKFVKSLEVLFKNSYLGLFIIILLLFITFIDKYSKLIFFSFVIPYFIFWSYFLSYDVRNVLIILPAICYIFSYFILYIYKKIFKRSKFIKIYNLILMSLIFATLIFFMNVKFDYDKIIKSNEEKVKNIGNVKVNQLLYHYIDKNKNDNQIYSHYYELKWLPGLKKRYKELNCTHGNIKSYRQLIKESTNNFYILFAPWCDTLIINYILNNNINIIFENDDFIFIEVKYD